VNQKNNEERSKGEGDDVYREGRETRKREEGKIMKTRQTPGEESKKRNSLDRNCIAWHGRVAKRPSKNTSKAKRKESGKQRRFITKS
jgi:hypothetical protein